ncbi:MAG: hypothetical protein F4X11_12225, partial [Acidobacteria bacterium]|nr:hypothetical protein [Acidobacteriota bacterium]
MAACALVAALPLLLAAGAAEAQTNRAPVFTPQGDTSINAPFDTLVNLRLSESDFSDPDGDFLEINLIWDRDDTYNDAPNRTTWNIPGGRLFFMHKSAAEFACLTPLPTSPHTTVATITATDPGGLTATATFSFTVSFPSLPACAPPTLENAIPDQVAHVGKYFSYTFPAGTFAAPQGQPLTYTATLADGYELLPSWLTFDAATRTFYGTPQSSNARSLKVRVVAAASNRQSVSDVFDIRVATQADLVPPTLSGATVDGSSSFTLHFAGRALDLGGRGCPSEAFTVKVDGVARRIVYCGIKAHSVALGLSSSAGGIHNGRPVTVSYDSSKASPQLKSVYNVLVRDFTDRPVTDAAPSASKLSVARVDGRKLTVTFTEPLDTGSAPAGNAFTVSGGRTGTGTASIAGATVTVTLDSAVTDGETVTVSYRAAERPNALRDPGGNRVSNFRGAALHNITGPPSFQYAEVHGKTLAVTFDEPLDAGSVPAPGAFHVTVSGARRQVAAGGVAIRGADVVLTLASPVAFYNTVQVRYTRPSANRLRDPAGEAVATFADREVNVYQLSHTGAQVSGVTIASDPGTDHTYGLNDPIRVRVAFDEKVHVTGSPRIAIDLDPGEGGTRHAAYASGSGTKALVFTYGVVEPDLSTQGIAVLANTLELNGGSIRSAPSSPTPGGGTGMGADADLSHDGLAHDPNHKVDWQQSPPEASGPSVTGVTVSSRPADGDTYGAGETIRVTVSLDEAVDVEGSPRLKIKMDPNYGEKWAAYESGGGTSALVFAHTVVEPNVSPQGIAVLADTLEANGGTIRSAETEADADLSHDGLAHDPAHKVDWQLGSEAEAPSATGVAVSSRPAAGDTYSLGETIRVAVTFSEAVAVTGSPRLQIDLDPADWGEKWAAYENGGGTDRLTFAYEVVEPNLSTEGVAVLANTLALNGGSIRSAETEAEAELGHAGLDHDPAHKVDWRPEAVTVTGVSVASNAGGDDTYRLGDTISIRVAFSEAVDVTGSPRLQIDLDPADWGEKWAAYASGGGSDALTFTHEVVEPNYSTRGIAVLADTLEANGGSIRSAATEVDAELSHDGLGHDPAHKVDWRPGLSVADARVEEGAGVTVDFAVRLGRAATETVTVDYVTADGTARAGEDYTAASGTLRFAAGESSKTVAVAVLDDAHDEGEETFTLALSNVSGAWLEDGEATGTIENTDLMPAALLARFGRATAEQVVTHIEERMAAPRRRGFRARFAGREFQPGQERDFALGFLSQFTQPMGMGAAGAAPMGGMSGSRGMGGMTGMGMAGSMGMSSAAGMSGMSGMGGMGGVGTGGMVGSIGMAGQQPMGYGSAGDAHETGLFGSMLGYDPLSNSEFELNRESRGGILSVWSRSSRSYFSGTEDALSLNGDVRTSMFGADWARGPLTLGLSVGRTLGLGGYSGPSGGRMSTSMTGF